MYVIPIIMMIIEKLLQLGFQWLVESHQAHSIVGDMYLYMLKTSEILQRIYKLVAEFPSLVRHNIS